MGLSQIKVQLLDYMGNDRAIAETAWTSSMDQQNKVKRTTEDVERVIRYMAKHKHGTPFECVYFKFWLYIPLFTDRQHMTHRVASHNGLSGRYRTVPSEYYDLPSDVQQIFELAEAGVPIEVWQEKNYIVLPDLLGDYYAAIENARSLYKRSIDFLKVAEKQGAISNDQFKRAREVIRGVVPVATFTERVTTINLRSFANYQKQRNSTHAQPEIRRVAQLMLNQVKEAGICPIALAALQEEGWQI